MIRLISKVLVATDGSECANKALDYALDLAEKFSAPLLIVNVLKPPVYTSPDNLLSISPGMIEFSRDLRKTHEEILINAAKKAAALKPNVTVTSELREGNPPNEIVAVANEGNFDVIVLGHGGEGRIKEFFLGGTSERVAHSAQCAVLIVK